MQALKAQNTELEQLRRRLSSDEFAIRRESVMPQVEPGRDIDAEVFAKIEEERKRFSRMSWLCFYKSDVLISNYLVLTIVMMWYLTICLEGCCVFVRGMF